MTWTCPACANDNPELMESNGDDPKAMDFTLLCLGPDLDGVCGEQWEPNDPEFLLEDDEDAGIQRATSGQLRALGREGE